MHPGPDPDRDTGHSLSLLRARLPAHWMRVDILGPMRLDCAH